MARRKSTTASAESAAAPTKGRTTSKRATAAAPTNPVTDPTAGTQMRELLQALGKMGTKEQVQVGVRNICGSAVTLPPFANEPEITISPFSPSDPNSVAIISQARWNQLRKSSLYGQALIERFDDILDESVPRAPEDPASLCHPDHEKNRLPDPVAFIEESDEATLRKRIEAMTSENQLAHIIGTVDRKMKQLEAEFRAQDDPEASKNAVKELPMRYQMADKFAEWRLQSLSPSRVSSLPAPRKSVY